MLKKLGKDAVIYGGADFIFKAIAFATLPVYVRLFSVADFGLMSLLSVTAGLVGMLVNMGVSSAVQRFYWDPATTPENQPVIVSTGLVQLAGIGFMTLALAAVSIHAVGQVIYERYGIEWKLAMLAVCTVLPDQIVQFVQDTLRLHFTPLRFIILSFSKNLLGVALGLWLIIGLKEGLYGFFAGSLLASIATVPLALWFIGKDLTLRFDRQISREIFSYGTPFVFAGLAYWVFGSMDRWMLAELGNAREVGLYSVAFKIATIVTFVTAAFSQAWSPHVIKMVRDDPDYRKTFSRVFSLWYFLLAVIGLLISLFSREILMLLTPQDYWGAASVLAAVAMGLVLLGTTQITALGISIEKKTSLLTHGAWLTACVNLGLNYVLIPSFGAQGSAWATLLSYALLNAFFLYWGQKLHPVPLETRKLLYCTFLVAVALLSPALFSENSWNPIMAITLKLIFLSALIGGAFAMDIIDRQLLGRFSGKIMPP